MLVHVACCPAGVRLFRRASVRHRHPEQPEEGLLPGRMRAVQVEAAQLGWPAASRAATRARRLQGQQLPPAC